MRGFERLVRNIWAPTKQVGLIKKQLAEIGSYYLLVNYQFPHLFFRPTCFVGKYVTRFENPRTLSGEKVTQYASPSNS